MKTNATVTAVVRNALNGSGLAVPCADGEIGFDMITVTIDDGTEYTTTASKSDSGKINVGDRVVMSEPSVGRGRKKLGAGKRTISIA